MLDPESSTQAIRPLHFPLLIDVNQMTDVDNKKARKTYQCLTLVCDNESEIVEKRIETRK